MGGEPLGGLVVPENTRLVLTRFNSAALRGLGFRKAWKSFPRQSATESPRRRRILHLAIEISFEPVRSPSFDRTQSASRCQQPVQIPPLTATMSGRQYTSPMIMPHRVISGAWSLI